ncbi:MAG: SpoIIE family protein phosphatase [Anaerolineales bacterium]|nr:SpoIIE family protein phosphatase [Anaerolineales bacterium]
MSPFLLQITGTLSGASLTLFIVIAAMTFLILIAMRRYRSRQALMQRVAELEALSVAGRAIVTAELDLMSLCELIAQESGQVIDNRTFQIGLFDDHFYEILFWTINGRPQETPRAFDLSEGGGIAGWVRMSGKPLLVRDFQKEMDRLPAKPRYISDSPPRSAIFLPLISGEEVIGVVAAQSPRPSHFSEEDLRRLMILTNQAAAAIAHARLFNQQRQRAAQLELVSQIALDVTGVYNLREIFERVVQATKETFNFHLVNIFSIDPETGEAVIEASSSAQVASLDARLRPGEGIVGAALAQQETIVANDTAVDDRFLPALNETAATPPTRAEIAIPMSNEGNVIGVLDVQSPYTNAFTHNEQMVLAALAAEIAIAIDRARQLRWQREQAWLTAAQLQVAETIGDGSDLQEIVTAVTRLTPMLLGLSFCAILLWDKEQEAYHGGDVYGAPKRFRGWFRRLWLNVGEWGALDAVHVGRESLTTTSIPPWSRRMIGKNVTPSTLTLLPIDTANDTLGVMVIDEMTDGRDATSFSRRAELLQNIVDQAAQAIESACLRIAQQEEAWVNAALLQTAEAVNSLIDLNEILDTIVRLVPMLVGVESAVVLIWDADRETFRPGPSYGISEMGLGLLSTLELEQGELLLANTQAGVLTPNAAYYTFPLAPWLAKVLGSSHAHAFPLNARGQLVGALVVGVAEEKERNLSTRRISILNGIAHQAATAVVNNQLYQVAAERSKLEQELNVAREIQASLLPYGRPNIPGCEVASFWLAARQVSGDFYDFIRLDNGHWGIIIADVADKGVPAALFMALSRTILRTVAFNRQNPAHVLMRANEILDNEAQSDLFVTVFYGVWNPENNTLTYANGGHNPPLLLDRNGRSHLLTGDGMALGVLPQVTIQPQRVHLHSGDTLIFYTDGVTEAMNEDFDEFGLERLRVASAPKKRSAVETVEAITQAIHDHAGETPQFDDITLIVMKTI